MELTKKDLLEEKRYLDDTVSEIDQQIHVMSEKLNVGDEELKDFQKLMWASQQEMDDNEMNAFITDNDLKISLLEHEAKKLRNLYKVKDTPYFGSIVFNDEPIYIGITSVKKDMDYIVNDWRSPICSLFYDYELGYAKYIAPGGSEEGEITRKRQYKISNGRLRHVFDTNVNIDDDVLQDVLAQSSSDKMKNIVNTIQAEQNAVIRDSTTKNIIVQGIAGSGKTSVALHRIAFLLYKLDFLTSENTLILSPNNVFAEYISDVLPELGESNTLQSTFHEFASAYISEYYRVEPYSSFVERFYKGVIQDNDLIKFKLSDESKGCMQKFCKYFTIAARFIEDIEYKEVVISKDELNSLLHERYDNKPLFERVNLIAEKINNTYFKGAKKDYISLRSLMLKSSNFKQDYKNIYKYFFESAIFKKHYKKTYKRNENVSNINKKVINYEDSTLFIFMKCLLEGYPYQVAMRQVVIDEAQDYTYLQYYIMKRIFKNASFTILGDVNQTVNPFYKYDNLNILLDLFGDSSKYLELSKTYRSSPEIIDYANKILGLNHVSAIRRDNNLPVIKRRLADLSLLYKDIEYLTHKYKSVAIITKSIDEAKALQEKLIKDYPKVSLIDIDTEKFNKKLVVAPAYGVKGLEFDSSIIINTFKKDKYLFYVAVTRSQHELIVYGG